MKKFIYSLLLMIPVAVGFIACDADDNDTPNVGIQATISGGVLSDDEIYVVQGDELKIDALTLVNQTKKDGAMGAVSYYWDHYLVGTNVVQPYSLTINTAEQPVGRHLLQAQMPIYVVDYPVCYGYIQYYVNIVGSVDEMPANPDGSTSRVVQGIIKSKE
ncbi:MAG: hypothetical protein K2L62_05325 [Muribaculaceae bacterium]|nr:hypothetical protein [Muribaculaceae bacterium]